VRCPLADWVVASPLRRPSGWIGRKEGWALDPRWILSRAHRRNPAAAPAVIRASPTARRKKSRLNPVLSGSFPSVLVAVEDQGCLARIIQDETRKNERGPGKPDWSGTEMSHVCIERFGTRDAQEHPTENKKPGTSAGMEITEPIPGIGRQPIEMRAAGVVVPRRHSMRSRPNPQVPHVRV
jgi:hypothetical protein